MNRFPVGETVEVTTTIRDGSGTLVDPSSLALLVIRPDGTSPPPYATPVRDSVGQFHVAVPIADTPQLGLYFYKWTAGVGTFTGLDPDVFFVFDPVDATSTTVAYATVDDLSTFLQTTVDRTAAEQAIQISSAAFSAVADTWWARQKTTYQIAGNGSRILQLPFRPVVAVSAVRIAGVTVTDCTLIRRTLYRLTGFGSYGGVNGYWPKFPPDLVEVDLTYGYTNPTDDVRGAVVESAAVSYQHPDPTVLSEQAGPFGVRYQRQFGNAPVAASLTPGAQALAESYRGDFLA